MILTPFADLTKCAECLDHVTLVKQCISVYRLLERLEEQPSSNTGRRFTILWRPYPQALIYYGELLALRCKRLGHTHIYDIFTRKFRVTEVIKLPKWLGWEPLHESHRGGLVFLDEKRNIKRGIKKYLLQNSLVQTIDQWTTAYCGGTLNTINVYSLSRIRHKLTLNNISLHFNFYTQQGFLEPPLDCFKWPVEHRAEGGIVRGVDAAPHRTNFTRSLN